MFKTNSLLNLVDYTYSSMKLSKIGSQILYGANLGSVGFPTANNFLAMTFIACDFNENWKLNEEKLQEYFPSVRFITDCFDISTQNEGKLPNQLYVFNPGNCMVQFQLYPLT